MTRLDAPPSVGPASSPAPAPPARFALVLLAAVAVPTVLLYLVPQPLFDRVGLLATLLVVGGGGVAVGCACTAVLRAASQQPERDHRGANAYFVLSGISFVVLCITAPAAVLIGAQWWYGFIDVDARAVLLTFVAGGGLLVGAVFAVAGALLLPVRGLRLRLAWAKVDLAAQLFALGSVLAVVAILY